MSEKRFVVNKKGIFDNKTKEVYLFVAYDWIECEIYEIVDLLNELAEKNERLKQEVKQYWRYRDIRKQKVKDLEKQLKHIQNLIYKDKMQRLEDE